METIQELTTYVQDKAKDYYMETGTEIETFPISIVDFVIEQVSNSCHFPPHFTEKNIVKDLEKGKSVLAMACAEIYAKSGAEGQIMHTENGITRMYEKSWITPSLLSHFPNYVNTI